MALTVSYSRTDLKADFQTNTYTPGNQLAPDVLGLANGGLVSAYNNGDLADGSILLEFYDAGFNMIAGPSGPYEFPPGTKAIGQPSLTQLSNGNVLVVWED